MEILFKKPSKPLDINYEIYTNFSFIKFLFRLSLYSSIHGEI